MNKEKTKVGKILQVLGSAVVRPAAKILFPLIGSPVVELVSNLIGSKKIDSVTGAITPKHSYISIAVQFALVISVLYAFYTKSITIQEVVDILNQFIPTETTPG